MSKEIKWSANEKQKKFMEILKKYPDGITLKEIEVAEGETFATGSINTLLGKGLVDGNQKKEVQCELVAEVCGKKVVVGTTKKSWTVYKLVE
jgi:hypothetical protein